MESFALWYEGETNRNAIVNINLWKNYSHNNNDYFIDIGLLIKNCRNVTNVYFYIPRRIEKDDIFDLGKTIIRNNDLARAIFNSPIKAGDAREGYEAYEKNITIVDKELTLLIVSFIESKNWNITYNDNATIVSFDISKLIDKTAQNVYIRFRIHLVDSSILAFDETPKSWVFQSAINCIETVELRLNDHRLFNRYLLERLEESKTFYIEATHLFIMRDGSDELLDQHELSDIRLLENDIWTEYISQISLGNKTVAYHYKNKDSHDDVSFFSRIKYQKIKPYLIIGYILTAIGLAVSANLITDLIKSIHLLGILLLFLILIILIPRGRNT